MEEKAVKCRLYHDNFQNFKSYAIPKAQLVIADIPYNLSDKFYASRPEWYVDGDNKNGESSKAHSAAFTTDVDFRIAEYFHFCNRLLRKEPAVGQKDAPCMIVFCAFEQLHAVIAEAEKYGFKHAIPLVFVKPSSPQVLKANMKIVGATEYALVLYRNRLPKFRNIGADGQKHMVKNWFEWKRDGREYPKIHPTQKPIGLLKTLIGIFTDPGDVVIDPVAGSGSTLRAAYEMGRNAYGFEVSREFYERATTQMLAGIGQNGGVNENSGTEGTAGIGTQTGRVQPPEKAEAGR